jgi:hypothetical protein
VPRACPRVTTGTIVPRHTSVSGEICWTRCISHVIYIPDVQRTGWDASRVRGKAEAGEEGSIPSQAFIAID